MQRLLTEAYAEFEFEEPAKVPGSEYVKRCPKETDKQSRGVSTAEGIPHKSSQGVSTAEGIIHKQIPGTEGRQVHIKAKACQPLRASFTSRSAPKAVHKSSQGVSTAEANHINMHNHGTQVADPINMHGNEANHINMHNHGNEADLIKQHQLHQQITTFQQEDTQEGGAHDGCPSSEKDAPAGGANNGGQDASAEGVCGCGREKSQGDDGGYAQLQLFHDNGDKEDA